MKKVPLLVGLLMLMLTSCNQDDDIATNSVSPQNLIAYYPFNGNSLNEANSNYNGSVEGAILTSDRDDILNSAFRFNGVDDIIRINHNNVFNLRNGFTISALVNPSEIKTQSIIRKGTSINGAGTWPYGISLSQTGDIVFTVSIENGQTINQVRKVGYPTNQWFLVTGVFNDSQMFLYVNGELEASDAITGQINTNEEPLLIGSRLSLPSDTFNGIIDEVRIYNAPLSAIQVRALYDNL